MTLTGAKADHRLAVKPSQMPEIAKAIAAALGVGGCELRPTRKTRSGSRRWRRICRHISGTIARRCRATISRRSFTLWHTR